MTITDMHSFIISNTLFQHDPPVYVFFGEEHYTRGVYVEKIAEVTQRTIKRSETIKDSLKEVGGFSFNNVSYLNVVIDDYEIFENSNFSWEVIKTPTILILNTVDKTRKYYKDNAEKFIEFNFLDPIIKQEFLKNTIKLELNNTEMSQFLKDTNPATTAIINESDKVFQFAQSLNISHSEAFFSLLIAGTLCKIEDVNVFNIVSDICSKSFQVLSKIDYLLNEGSILGIMALIYSTFRNMLVIKTYKGYNLQKETGVTNYQKVICDGILYRGNWKVKELKKIMKLITDLDIQIKTGLIEERFAFNYLVISIMK